MKINKLAASFRIFAKLGLSKITGKPIPFWAWNYITNRCNLKCKYCFVEPYWDGAKDPSFDELCKIFAEEKKMGVEIITLLGGEPTIREDFSDIIEYLHSIGVIIEVITNGYFIKKHAKVLDKIDFLCISLDGNEETVDSLRGHGAFKKATEAIEFAKSRGVTVRIHGVLTKYTINSLPEVAQLCKEYGVSATYAMPSIHKNEDILKVSDEEVKEFWKSYLKLKKEGAPFMQSETAIKTIVNWPHPYYKVLKKNDVLAGEKVPKCRMKDNLILVGGNGELYPCTVKYNQKGLNAEEVGVRKAFEYLHKTDDCYACSDFSCINLSLIANLDHRVMLETIKTFLKYYGNLFNRKNEN